MSTFTSTLFAAQDATLAALAAQTWPDGVVPELGAPAKMDRNAVWVSGEVSDWTRRHPVSALAQADESYLLPIHALVTWLGGDYHAARLHMETVAGLIELALSDFTLDGSVAFAVVERSQIEEAIVDDGRRRQLLLSVYVRVSAHLPAGT